VLTCDYGTPTGLALQQAVAERAGWSKSVFIYSETQVTFPMVIQGKWKAGRSSTFCQKAVDEWRTPQCRWSRAASRVPAENWRKCDEVAQVRAAYRDVTPRGVRSLPASARRGCYKTGSRGNFGRLRYGTVPNASRPALMHKMGVDSVGRGCPGLRSPQKKKAGVTRPRSALRV